MSDLMKNSGSAAPDSAVPRIQRLLTVKDVADWLRLSPRTIRRLIADKKLPALRIGRAVRVRREDVEAFIAGQEMPEDGSNGQS